MLSGAGEAVGMAGDRDSLHGCLRIRIAGDPATQDSRVQAVQWLPKCTFQRDTSLGETSSEHAEFISCHGGHGRGFVLVSKRVLLGPELSF